MQTLWHDEFAAAGLPIGCTGWPRLQGPVVDTDYGMREFAVVDPDGNLQRICHVARERQALSRRARPAARKCGNARPDPGSSSGESPSPRFGLRPILEAVEGYVPFAWVGALAAWFGIAVALGRYTRVRVRWLALPIVALALAYWIGGGWFGDDYDIGREGLVVATAIYGVFFGGLWLAGLRFGREIRARRGHSHSSRS